MLKLFKRYSVVGALIVFCFFSAFIALCNGLLSVAQISNLIQKENQYAYTNEIQATIRVTESISPDTLLELVQNVSVCNVYLENMSIYFDQIDSVYRPDILLCQNEILSLPTTKAVSNLPTGCIIAPSSNVAGKSELSIHGKTFSIYDRLDAEEYPFVTGLFVINGSEYFEAFPEVLDDTNTVILRISSSKDDVYSTYSLIKENLILLIPDSSIYSSTILSTDSVFQGVLSQGNIISLGLFLFALINTIIISYYWVVVRRREIAIRKAFGASNFSVISLMARELLKLIGSSAILALAVQTLMWVRQGNSIGIKNSILIIVILLLAITIAVFIAMIIPVRFILQIQPSEGVKL